jgi:ribosomal protein S27E
MDTRCGELFDKYFDDYIKNNKTIIVKNLEIATNNMREFGDSNCSKENKVRKFRPARTEYLNIRCSCSNNVKIAEMNDTEIIVKCRHGKETIIRVIDGKLQLIGSVEESFIIGKAQI